MTGLSNRILRLLAGILLSVSCSLAFPAPLVEIDSGSVLLDLPPYIDILEDPDGSLTIGDVTSERHAFQFAPAPMTELYFGYTRSVYWMRFTVENQRDVFMHFLLEAAPADIDYLDLYAIDPDTGQLRQHVRSGSAMPYGDRAYDHPLHLFDLTIEPHAAYTYYVRAESDKTVNLELRLGTPDKFLHLIGERDWWQGYLLGALVVACILHMALFALFHFRSFLWYSLFLAGVIGIQVSWNGYLLQFFPHSETLLDHQIMTPIYLAVLFSTLFAQSLLRTRKRSLWQHHTFTALAAAALAGAIGTWFLPVRENAVFASGLAMLSIVLIFASTLHANMEGERLARHFLIARTTTTGVVLVSIFNMQGYLPQGSFASWGVACAVALESIIMAISMTRHCLDQMRRTVLAANEAAYGRQEQGSLVNLADICHELRTPISGVLGMADLLLGGNITEQQRNQIKTIHKSGQALLDVTNKLSDLSSIERGTAEINTAPFELTPLVESCVEHCRGRAEFNNIELIYHIDSHITGFVRGDQEKLQQAIINLLQFALRHVEQGEVVLGVSPAESERVAFSIRSGHNTLVDRVTLTETRPLGSSDQLNLTIAEQFIRLMGGSLSVQSFVDGGVSICFNVPLPPQEGKVQPSQDDNLILQGRRLLIVDDNATCCTIIEQQAVQWGMTVQSSHGGKEALAILRSRTTIDELFDIVLIDYDMPGMNGLELAEHIQQDPNINHEKLLLVMLTGVSKAPSKIMAENAAIERVLYKPLSGKSLKQALQAALAQHLQKRRR
jgi:signal transduction histidine kinase/CheY-like chemotaxis protein